MTWPSHRYFKVYLTARFIDYDKKISPLYFYLEFALVTDMLPLVETILFLRDRLQLRGTRLRTQSIMLWSRDNFFCNHQTVSLAFHVHVKNINRVRWLNRSKFCITFSILGTTSFEAINLAKLTGRTCGWAPVPQWSSPGGRGPASSPACPRPPRCRRDAPLVE